jgi:iron complex transport system ATP-binding protein
MKLPVFSRALVLKDGKVIAAGKKSSVLKTNLLSTAFAARLQLSKVKNRYSMNVLPKRGVVI